LLGVLTQVGLTVNMMGDVVGANRIVSVHAGGSE
jgi:hypothetical protein